MSTWQGWSSAEGCTTFARIWAPARCRLVLRYSPMALTSSSEGNAAPELDATQLRCLAPPMLCVLAHHELLLPHYWAILILCLLPVSTKASQTGSSSNVTWLSPLAHPQLDRVMSQVSRRVV